MTSACQLNISVGDGKARSIIGAVDPMQIQTLRSEEAVRDVCCLVLDFRGLNEWARPE